MSDLINLSADHWVCLCGTSMAAHAIADVPATLLAVFLSNVRRRVLMTAITGVSSDVAANMTHNAIYVVIIVEHDTDRLDPIPHARVD